MVATAEMSTGKSQRLSLNGLMFNSGIHPASTNDDEDARSTAADTADTSQSAAHTETGTTESHKKKGRIVFDESDEDESDDSDEENDDEGKINFRFRHGLGGRLKIRIRSLLKADFLRIAGLR